MSTTQLRFAGTGLFYIFIFLFGFLLSRTGKPYNMAIFTLHKLVALGAIVFLGITIYRIQQATPLNPAQIWVILLIAVCFLATLVTGGLLSVDKAMPLIVRRLHQVIPYLTLLSTSAAFYLLLGRSV